MLKFRKPLGQSITNLKPRLLRGGFAKKPTSDPQLLDTEGRVRQEIELIFITKVNHPRCRYVAWSLGVEGIRQGADVHVTASFSFLRRLNWDVV